ncbi:response regulator [Rhodoblastus acidophilus]|uniref:Response regulator n=1 Tax=Candidatus Rhodoblastus alkanivorans TaxID=2954117 RepID=A0ABS9Z704_9HYPH|nr:response regulator [Candidatus Rhodoblastus alkanivorans]MCI4680142.1 response regulator [Candidatus Rhodoblastus alkanivorans]MCI4683396.1 response regulator [Candidatus Rhodoblastus alkanivorans]MDI4640706.1 response regulator [Rhodoblastus acidophilus]
MAVRLLLVDDDPMLGLLVADWLSESGCEVVGPARTVKAALDLVEKERDALDAALLDVALDRGNSYPVADALALYGVPFAFVTGHGLGGLAPAYREAPILTKPFQFDDLQRIIDRLVAVRGRK